MKKYKGLRRSSKLRSSTRARVKSRARRARQIANEELARLKLEQLKQHRMEREAEAFRQQRAECEVEAKRKLAEQVPEIQLRRESLQATHEVQAASIKRQVWEEESDRGSYIFRDDAMLHLDQPSASNQVNFVAAKVTIVPNATPSGNVPGTQILFQENRGSNAEPRYQRNFTTAPTRGEAVCTVPWVHDCMEQPRPALVKFDSDPTYQTYQGSTINTLCDRRLSDKLGMPQEVEFSLTTINKHLVNRHGRKVQLNVAPLDGSDVIELPSVFPVGRWPVAQNPSLCCKDLQSWPHFGCVISTVLPDAKVLLLIGVDAPEKFWTLEESRGKRRAILAAGSCRV